MSGIKIYNVDFNGIRLSKGMTVEEFKSWIVSTVGGIGFNRYWSAVQSHDGGYVVIGQQNSEGQGDYDGLIVKYDSNLNVVTQKGLGGLVYDRLEYIIQSNDGGYVAVGYQTSEGQGGNDALIVKYDSNLNLVTQKALGGSRSDYYYSIVQSNDGGYVVVGFQNSEGQDTTSSDALIVKYDANLNLVTQKALGSSASDNFYSICQSHDGGYIAVGYQNSDAEGVYDALIVKYDSNLNVVTQKSLGGLSSDYYRLVCQSDDGGYVVAGYQQSEGQGDYDALIVKYDSNLNVITQKGLGGTGSDRYHSICQSYDGGYIVVGYQGSDVQGAYDALIVKYDANLNVISQKGLGGTDTDIFYSVIQSNDGGYVVVGYQNLDAQNSSNALITKLPDDFNLITGPLVNHSGLSWTTPSLIETTPILTETTLSLVETTLSLTETSTNLVETSPSLVEARSEKQ